MPPLARSRRVVTLALAVVLAPGLAAGCSSSTRYPDRGGGSGAGGTPAAGGASAGGAGMGAGGAAGAGGASTGGTGIGADGGTAAGGATPSAGGAPLAGGAPGSGGAAVDPPTPAAPCGDDPDVRNGTVIPDVGTLPSPSAFAGTDPAESGALAFTTQALTVPIAAETFQGADLTITVAAGQLPGTAWLPSGTSRQPLVIVLAGFQASYTFYAPYAEHLATHGFVVLGVDTRSNLFVASHAKEALEVMRTLDWALSASPFAARIDGTKVAVAGHSKGGKVAFFTAALDPRIDVSIGWDPVNAGGGPCAFDPSCNALPVAPNCAVSASGVQYLGHSESLVIGAPPDPAFNPDPNHNAIHFYRGAPSPASLVMLSAGHAAWATGAGDAGVFLLTKRVHTAVLLRRFLGVTGLEAFLPPSPALSADPLVLQISAK